MRRFVFARIGMNRWPCTLLLLALLASGCATRVIEPADDCTRWFAQLDAAVDAAGVRDAQDERIDGFAGFRVDRFGEATRDSVDAPAWLARAATLDEQGRNVEIANLPRAAYPLGDAADDSAARARSDDCRARRVTQLQSDATARQTLLSRATVPDRYATPLRAFGLYPLARLPFFAGVNNWQTQHEKDMARWAATPPPRQRFAPPRGSDAPLFEIETRGGALAPFDRFGVPAWRDGSSVPDVDTTQPVVFERDAQTLYFGRVLKQRVFTLWFPERPLAGRFDLLGGALDGVIVRLTYAPDGSPLMLDTIHACGCYHLFFPADTVRLRDGAPTNEEWAFVPARLPQLKTGERLVVRIASATHYVTGIAAVAANSGVPYTLRDEHLLRTLPRPGGGTRSLYAADGLVRGSERGERFFFWPMGIASAGAMRQWGHHATAFVGRRHFDDPNLLAERFVLPLLPSP
jgi:hypothetical protein